MGITLFSDSANLSRGRYRRIVQMLVWLVIVPTVVLLGLGILMLVFWQAQLNILFGILVVTLVACLVTGAVLSLVFLRREARLSQLQLDFVSKVSHELRTPLTSIRMFAETLRRRGLRNDEQTQLCLDVLERESSRLSARIERLLDWGRMESGRRVYERQPVTIEAVVTEAVDTVAPIAAEAGLSLDVDLADDLPEMLLDRGAMVDAMVNLLSNACKYNGGSGSIEVRAWAEGRFVRVAVTDHGVGIHPREQRNVFQKFYRVDERLSAAAEGSGLGLAIVSHVAQGHGGTVELESVAGEGSTFTLVLPMPRPWWEEGGMLRGS